MISARGLVAGYGPATVLRDVSIELGAGDGLALTGPAGSGRTTLLRVLAGWVPLRSGAIHLQGEATAADARRLRRTVGYASDDLLAGSGLRVGEYLRFVSGIRGPRAGADSWLTAARRVGVDPTAGMDTLGRERRAAVAIAATLLTGAPVVLIDDGIDGIEPGAQSDIVAWLAERRAEGTAMIVVTADKALGDRLCQREMQLTKTDQNAAFVGAGVR